VADQIAAAVALAMTDASLHEQGLKLAIDYAGSTPDEFASFVASERQRWGGMVRTLGLKPE
jgi:tripartite-type tricarboxylate transporter receptor subunit TctC